MTFIDADVVRVLEEVLPRRFGGGPSDYQLVEEEADDGQPLLRLLVHPAVGTARSGGSGGAFLAAIGGGSGAARIMALSGARAAAAGGARAAPHRRLGRSSTSGPPVRPSGAAPRPDAAGRAAQDTTRRRAASVARLRAVAAAPPMSSGNRGDGGPARACAITSASMAGRGVLGGHDPVDASGLLEFQGLLHLLGEVGGEPGQDDAPRGRLVELRARVVAAHRDDEPVGVQPRASPGTTRLTRISGRPPTRRAISRYPLSGS